MKIRNSEILSQQQIQTFVFYNRIYSNLKSNAFIPKKLVPLGKTIYETC